MPVINLLTTTSGAASGDAVKLDQYTNEPSQVASYQANVTGTGAVTATVVIEVSNSPTVHGWMTMATITLSGTTTATDGIVDDASWGFCRARTTAISGTGATVNATVCI
jgi:hypothetical protein